MIAGAAPRPATSSWCLVRLSVIAANHAIVPNWVVCYPLALPTIGVDNTSLQISEVCRDLRGVNGDAK